MILVAPTLFRCGCTLTIELAVLDGYITVADQDVTQLLLPVRVLTLAKG